MDKFTKINLVLKDFFELNPNVKKVAAKDMMPYFVLASVFKNDEKNGAPILNFIRRIDKKNQLKYIPFLFADRKEKYTKWYFVSGNYTISKIVKIQKAVIKKKPKLK